jgi:S-adenosylmethionine/arginine decarboxylase-like enzyme
MVAQVPRPPVSAWRLATVELAGIPPQLLEDAQGLERVLERAFGVGPIAWARHEFVPRGASVTGSAARLRVALHTWPESGVSTLDVWSADDAETLLRKVVAALGALTDGSHDAE